MNCRKKFLWILPLLTLFLAGCAGGIITQQGPGENTVIPPQTSTGEPTVTPFTEPTVTSPAGTPPAGESGALPSPTPRQLYKLTVNITGSGTVTSNLPPPMNSIVNNTADDVLAGTHVVLSTTPDACHIFRQWKGGVCAGPGACELDMDAPKTVEAEFVKTCGPGPGPNYKNLTVNIEGYGKVNINYREDGSFHRVLCSPSSPSDCTKSFPLGTSIILEAQEPVPASFVGWRDCPLVEGIIRCKFDLANNIIVTAQFNPLKPLEINPFGEKPLIEPGISIEPRIPPEYMEPIINEFVMEPVINIKPEVSKKWISFSSGNKHTCAVAEDNSLWCWGNNKFGQLGNGDYGINADGTDKKINIPVRVGSGNDWDQIAAGYNFTCGIKKESGALLCWGKNNWGQLGDGTFDDKDTPTPVSSGDVRQWLSVTAGSAHTCGIAQIGSDPIAMCWGYGAYGQLGIGSVAAGYKISAPQKLSEISRVKTITAGSNFTCAIDDYDQLWCWGMNDTGQLGIGVAGPSTYKYVPTAVVTNPYYPTTPCQGQWKAVSAGSSYVLGVDISGYLCGWGYNGAYQLGDGTTTNKLVPSLILEEPSPGAGSWQSVSASFNHSCATDYHNKLYCWGQNSEGQLGTTIGGVDSARRPMMIATEDKWKSVNTGELYTCGLKEDNTLWCWGNNDFGQLGDDTNERRTTPTSVE